MLFTMCTNLHQLCAVCLLSCNCTIVVLFAVSYCAVVLLCFILSCSDAVTSHTHTSHTHLQMSSHPPLSTRLSPTVLPEAWLILDFGDDRRYFAQATSSGNNAGIKLSSGKTRINTASLIGLPYGSVVEVANGKTFVRTSDDEISPAFLSDFTEISDTQFATDGATDGDTAATSKPLQGKGSNDNRDLKDTSSSQSLSYETIQEMRSSGTDGETLIKSLISNSATFQDKTEFSKAKYIKRKAKKYLPRARLVRCTAGVYCEILFNKSTQKAMSLREDSLSQILAYANVYAGSQPLLFDSLGITTAAVLERMGGFGRLMSVFTSQDPPHKEIMSRFNFDYRDLEVLKWVSAMEVFSPNEGTVGGERPPDVYEEEKKQLIGQGWPTPIQEHTIEHLQKMESDEARHNFLFKRAGRFIRKMTRNGRDETLEWLERKSDSLIITTRFEPLPVLQVSRTHTLSCSERAIFMCVCVLSVCLVCLVCVLSVCVCLVLSVCLVCA